MENPEKPAIHGTQDEDKQNKNTIQPVLDTTIRTQTPQTRHDPLPVTSN